MNALVRFELCVPADVKHEGAWFYSSCNIFDVHSQGKTKQEALENLFEALQLFVESCFERGTLEQVLRECGFHRDGEMEGLDECSDGDIIRVPLSLIAQNAQAHAH